MTVTKDDAIARVLEIQGQLGQTIQEFMRSETPPAGYDDRAQTLSDGLAELPGLLNLPAPQKTAR